MSQKSEYLILFGASLVIGLGAGWLLAKSYRIHRKLWRVLNFVGAIGFVVGLIGVEEDHRFLLLANLGLGFQLAGTVMSFRREKVRYFTISSSPSGRVRAKLEKVVLR